MESVGLHEEWPWKSGLVRELERGTGSVKEVLVGGEKGDRAC